MRCFPFEALLHQPGAPGRLGWTRSRQENYEWGGNLRCSEVDDLLD